MPSQATKLPPISNHQSINQQICLEESINKEQRTRLMRHLQNKSQNTILETENEKSNQYFVMKRKLLALRPRDISLDQSQTSDTNLCFNKNKQIFLPKIKQGSDENIVINNSQVQNYNNETTVDLNENNFEPSLIESKITSKQRNLKQPTLVKNKKDFPTKEMKEVESKVIRLLYEQCPAIELGGRNRYLKERTKVAPSDKYYWPTLSSWEYGWGSNPEIGRVPRTNVKTRILENTFYRSNGVELL